MQATIPSTGLAILGLLSLRSFTAYELAQQMRLNYRFFWPRAESRVYAELRSLVRGRLAVVTTERTGKRKRSRYTITLAGKKAMKRWLASPDVSAPYLENEALLRCFLGTLTEPDALGAALEHSRTFADEILAAGQAVGEAYLAGTSPFQADVHARALVFDFLFRFATLLDEWAVVAHREVASWQTTALAERQKRGKATIRNLVPRIAAQRKARASGAR